MKHSLFLLMIISLISACNSYDHESYIAKFKTDFDNKLNSYTLNKLDSARLQKEGRQTIEQYRLEKIANNRFYIDNYSWYQLGKNLMLSPDEAKQEAFKYGFERPFYFLEFLQSDTTIGPVKNQVLNEVRSRLFDKIGKDSVEIYKSSAKQLFSAVHYFEESKYFVFINVDFERLKEATAKQRTVGAQMTYSAMNRIKENLINENGIYSLKVKNGEEIGISENLFKIGKGLILDINKEIIEKRMTQPDFEIDLTAENAQFFEMNWEQVYSLYKKYN